MGHLEKMGYIFKPQLPMEIEIMYYIPHPDGAISVDFLCHGNVHQITFSRDLQLQWVYEEIDLTRETIDPRSINPLQKWQINANKFLETELSFFEVENFIHWAMKNVPYLFSFLHGNAKSTT